MKLPENISRRTVHFFNETCSPRIIFILSLCSMAGFLFIKDVRLIWIAAAVFFLLSLARRGKIRILPSLVITVSVTFFALLSPFGKVLFSLGGWHITSGALISGLHRSGILIGMVFLSQFAVSPRLNLPGRPGAFLSQMFMIFDQLTARRISFKPGTIISSIDSRLTEIWNASDEH